MLTIAVATLFVSCAGGAPPDRTIRLRLANASSGPIICASGVYTVGCGGSRSDP